MNADLNNMESILLQPHNRAFFSSVTIQAFSQLSNKTFIFPIEFVLFLFVKSPPLIKEVKYTQ